MNQLQRDIDPLRPNLDVRQGNEQEIELSPKEIKKQLQTTIENLKGNQVQDFESMAQQILTMDANTFSLTDKFDLLTSLSKVARAKHYKGDYDRKDVVIKGFEKLSAAAKNSPTVRAKIDKKILSVLKHKVKGVWHRSFMSPTSVESSINQVTALIRYEVMQVRDNKKKLKTSDQNDRNEQKSCQSKIEAAEKRLTKAVANLLVLLGSNVLANKEHFQKKGPPFLKESLTTLKTLINSGDEINVPVDTKKASRLANKWGIAYEENYKDFQKMMRNALM